MVVSRAEAEIAKLNIVFERGLDIDGRRIYIFDEIDEKLASDVIKSLEYLSGTDGGIIIMINSAGGSLGDMFAIYDAIRACPNEITTIGFGEVCSAAGLLLVAGDHSLAARNCLFMSHQVSGGVDATGSLRLTEAQVAATRLAWDRWAACMAKHTNHTLNWWSKEMPTKHQELWWTVEDMQQKQHGIIEGVWE